MPRRSRTGDDRLARPDRVRRALQKPTARGSRISRCGGGSRASHLVHGPEDHDRLGHARQQGSRADRGALPVRARVREYGRRRAADLRRPQPHPLPGRRSARTRGLPRHARADLLRAHVSRAARDTGSRSRSHEAHVARVQPPDPERFPLLPLARDAGKRGGTYPCAFNAANEVAVAAFLDGRIGFLEIRSSSRTRSTASTGVPPAISPSSSKPMLSSAPHRGQIGDRMSTARLRLAVVGETMFPPGCPRQESPEADSCLPKGGGPPPPQAAGTPPFPTPPHPYDPP